MTELQEQLAQETIDFPEDAAHDFLGFLEFGAERIRAGESVEAIMAEWEALKNE